MKKNITVAALTLCICISMLCGCIYKAKEPEAKAPFTIGVVTKSRSSEYWLTAVSYTHLDVYKRQNQRRIP